LSYHGRLKGENDISFGFLMIDRGWRDIESREGIVEEKTMKNKDKRDI
jgi:hypothetical protein